MIKYAEYVVGGFVRDTILKSGGGYSYRPKDIDYVVTGSSINDMVDRFGPTIGADFPVWLDSDGNEWALARIERSIGDGYGDFTCDVQNVSIEDDLRRRDFTINAMAVEKGSEWTLGFCDTFPDDSTNLIDPFGGLKDLKNKVIRHVSDAFAEDPLRVLRCARFAARYYHLGFTVAPETKELCRQMVRDGMLHKVSSERIWVETEKALDANDPIVYFDLLAEFGFIPELGVWDRIHAIHASKTYRGHKQVFMASLEFVELLQFLNAPKKYISVAKKTIVLDELMSDGFVSTDSGTWYRVLRSIGLWGNAHDELDMALSACRVPLITAFAKRVKTDTLGIKLDVEPGPEYGHALAEARIRIIEGLLKNY
ncbi:tRNA nucleotidyltransferase [Vibrio phage D479]